MINRVFKLLIGITIISLLSATNLFATNKPTDRVFHINNDSLQRINEDLWKGLYGKISGIVIYSNSKLIYERYFGFSNSNTLQPISSVTKSITSLIAGVCVDKGYIPSIDVPIWKYFPEYKYIFENDTLKKRITIRNLLNQTSGFEWDEWTTHYSYAGNSLIELSQSDQNWVETTLKLPVNSKPGSKFNYNSENSQIIKEVLQRASGHDFEWLVKNFLFTPLGISEYHWDIYPKNGVPAWGGISLSTRSMARFGSLICNYGCWNNVQVVSNDWIEKSIQIESSSGEVNYGLHWWISKQPDGNSLVYAAGYGDQYIYAAPDKKIVIAINSQNFTDYKWPKSIDELIKSILLSME